MLDATFGEVEYEEGYAYIGHKDLLFGGKEQSVEILIMSLGKITSQNMQLQFKHMKTCNGLGIS